MANKGIAAFKEFTAGLLAKITDPDQRRKAEESLSALEQIQPVAQGLGDGIAGQAEIDRTLQTLTTRREELDTRAQELDTHDQQLQTWREELTSWYTSNKELITAARTRPAAPAAPAAPAPGATPPGVMTEEAFNTNIANERAAFLGFSRDQNLITRDHFTRFGEIVDLEPLLAHPKIAQLGLTGVYELVHKDRLDQWKAADEKKREDAIRLDERQKVQASQAQMPYPSPTGVGSGSPLDALANTNKADGLVDAAAQHYNRLQIERNAAPAR